MHVASLGLALLLDRAALATGQWWRLWSGHWVHLDAKHAAINFSALALLALIAWRLQHLRRLALASLWLMPVISAALLMAVPQLQWYAGLSGLLHAWAAWLLVERGGRIGVAGALVLGAKLFWEAHAPAPPNAMPVIIEAHQLGALAGGFAAALAKGLRQRRKGLATHH